jgi:hypothetical protein
MRWQKSVRSAAITALATIVAFVVFAPTPANAAAILVVIPHSITAGFQVQVSATCGDNLNPAFVDSRAFGSVTLVPDRGVLRESVTVPATTRSGTYAVNLTCANGEKASNKLTVIGGGAPPNTNQGPHTGGGEMAAELGGKLTLYGGLAAITVGLGLWLVRGVRRRNSV